MTKDKRPRGPRMGWSYEPYTPRSARPVPQPDFEVRTFGTVNPEQEAELRKQLDAALSGTRKQARQTTYENLGREIGKLVATKQQAYGDSFGKSGDVMRILYPDGIPVDQLDDALTVVRVLDKLFRIATDKDALGESPWRDIAGYALLAVARSEKGDRV